MASHLLKIPLQSVRTSNPSCQFQATGILYPSCQFQATRILFSNLPFPEQKLQENHLPLSFFPQRSLHQSISPSLSIHCSVSSPNPPTSKEEAIFQAKTSLSTTLEKPLNNPKLTGRLKKLKQPRFRVEIPVIDDSPDSLYQLALDVFGDIPMKRNGSPVKILILWQNPKLAQAAIMAFQSHSSNLVEHNDISSAATGDIRSLNSADVVVFLAPETSHLEIMKTITDSLYPKSVVIFNPKWGFEEEGSFGDLSAFVGSFDVVYSFMGLEVRGVFSKRKGMIFRCVMDGVMGGERWNVLVEEEGELNVVSKFKARPSITEVENVLYNLMAMNSPITKSAKFLKGLVSNVTGKK